MAAQPRHLVFFSLYITKSNKYLTCANVCVPTFVLKNRGAWHAFAKGNMNGEHVWLRNDVIQTQNYMVRDSAQNDHHCTMLAFYFVLSDMLDAVAKIEILATQTFRFCIVHHDREESIKKLSIWIDQASKVVRNVTHTFCNVTSTHYSFFLYIPTWCLLNVAQHENVMWFYMCVPSGLSKSIRNHTEMQIFIQYYDKRALGVCTNFPKTITKHVKS